ncbi:MAG: MBL fold metallo-hydrolase [Deltaproteobacteria bacterium]|jgi:alkyl sulfatase BDS1-like metallo-beta-lactamase superfamily hydrolase|nr:MBL fold metallo-hydrolase [Deltaproteobacteria bacterium]
MRALALIATLSIFFFTAHAAFAAGAGGYSGGASSTEHFHPKGKPPSEHTIAALEAARAELPFSDTRDFDEEKKGFLAAPDFWQIKGEAGNIVWDMERYKFFLEGKDFASIHPSLQRQSTLNMNYGLYQVIPGIYQVRGFDLANITFIEGETGWIVFDPLTAPETAAAAKQLVDEQLGEKPVVAVVYSHSHVDHWGGVRGIVDEADVRAGKVQIIAPRAFMQFAISENVYAGNAMNRRVMYQYGVLLPASPFGHAGQGLAQNVANGNTGLIPPSRIIEKDFETLTIDGVEMEFMNTPFTEAPSEMFTWIPEKKVFWAAENVTGVFHNIYTLRGAQVRDAHAWAKYINEALYRYGGEAEVMIASHHWPRWGNERVQEVLRGQRDLYANINNQVLHLANQGVTINQIHNVYETPKSIAEQWYNRGYHGSPEHNSRAVVNRYLGYWDGNPATLIPLSPADSAPLYVEMMGGSKKILKKGKKLYEKGRYLEAQEILNKLVQAEPQNRKAKDLLADVFEQIGYQQENPGLRNSYLQAAYELRSGLPAGPPPNTAGPDVVRAMTTELFLDFVGIRMDSRQAEAEGLEFKVNLITPDNGEQFVVELSSATLTNIEGFQAEDADLTITIDRVDLEQTMMGLKTLRAQIDEGTANAEGERAILEKLASMFAVFTPDFEMMPGTREPAPRAESNPYEVGPVELRGE